MTFEQEVKQFVQQKSEEIVQLLGEVVTAQSVNGPAKPDAPYGQGPRDALDIMLNAARQKGFSVTDAQGYFGFAELDGQCEEHIATLGHLDVVPPGEGWDTDPYVMCERDGWLLGRGVSDNKGASVLTLFLLEFFKDRPLQYGLRAIFGCNEETGMEDMEHYNALYEPPMFAFTPDGAFPVSYGEKSIIATKYKSSDVARIIVSMEGAGAENVIPEAASAVLRTSKQLQDAQDITVVRDGDCVTVMAKGVGGHPAHPEGTRTALKILLDYLVAQKICEGQEQAALMFLQSAVQDNYGACLGIDCELPHFTPLTACGTMLSVQNGCFVLTFNIRAPFGCNIDDILCTLDEHAQQAGFTMEPAQVNMGIFQDPDSERIKILAEVYNNISGTKEPPVTMSGGTYARSLANCVSYGIDTPHGQPKPPFVGQIHGRNEGVEIQNLLLSLEVFIHAVARLQNT